MSRHNPSTVRHVTDGHNPLRPFVLGASLLFLSLYLPLAGMIYLPFWYQLNCHWHGRCERLGEQRTERSITNLTAFFSPREAFHERWSEKEKAHLGEVRDIYDALALLALLAALALALSFDRARIARPALINVCVIAALLLVLPVFEYFWRHVFHGALFDNELWKTNRRDITWYLTPRTLFRNAVMALVGAGMAINLAVWWLARERRSP